MTDQWMLRRLEHGAYCLGCCRVLIGLLFVGGVMNVLWIAGISIFVFLEKVLPIGRWNVHAGSIAGIGLIISGVGVLALRSVFWASNNSPSMADMKEESFAPPVCCD